uniref:Uncharacterized protein n=1 Tax=Strigamia maritima TaxID=126957 RepID=T1J7K1_STRMM
MVNLKTTGNETVRFNPNLYNVEKFVSLCWERAAVRRANGGIAKLQLLVSIQSFIFISEPFFNEPGFESQTGTEEGKKLSEAYIANQSTANFKL